MLLMSVLQLFLWPLDGSADLEVDGETFDEALARINSNISSLLQLTNFSAGNISVFLCTDEYVPTMSSSAGLQEGID